MLRRLFSWADRRRVFVAIGIIISCCISFSVVYGFPRLWGKYLSVIPGLVFLQPLYAYWEISRLARIGTFALLAALLAALSVGLLLPRFIPLWKRIDRRALVLGVTICAAASWWIVNRIHIPMPLDQGVQQQIEIIPQTSGVNLLEVKIDGRRVSVHLLNQGEGWEQRNGMVLYTGEGNAPLVYAFENRANTRTELLFMGTGRVKVMANAQEAMRGELARDTGGERLVSLLTTVLLGPNG